MSLARPALNTITRLARAANRANGQSAIKLSDVRSLLCVELTRMGDVISMLPALQALKKRISHARLNVAVDWKYKPLFRFAPYVENVFAYKNSTNPNGFLRVLASLLGSKYDLVCSMSPSYRNALLTLLLRARAKVGYLTPRDSLTLFLHTAKVEGRCIMPFTSLEYNRENIYERSLKICKTLGIPTDDGHRFLQIPDNDFLSLQSKLIEKGFDITQSYVVIHPFGGWEFRHWSLEETAILIDRFLESGKKVALIGGDSERKLGEKICSLVRDPGPIWKAFGLPLDELAVLLKNAKIFIGTDSGPLHLAAALSTPSLGLYGPAHPKYTAPSQLSAHLFKQVECSPCEQRECVRPENPCMYLISAEEVYKKITEIVK